MNAYHPFEKMYPVLCKVIAGTECCLVWVQPQATESEHVATNLVQFNAHPLPCNVLHSHPLRPSVHTPKFHHDVRLKCARERFKVIRPQSVTG